MGMQKTAVFHTFVRLPSVNKHAYIQSGRNNMYHVDWICAAKHCMLV